MARPSTHDGTVEGHPRAASTPGATLPEWFAAAAHKSGEITIVDEGGERESRSFERLLEEGASVGAGLVTRGIRPGDRVAVAGETSFDFILGCLGAWHAGALVVTVPVPPARALSRDWSRVGGSLLARVAASVFLAANERMALPEGTTAIPLADLPRGRSRAADVAPDEPAAIQFTSGTTFASRGAVLSHRAVVAYLSSLERAMGYVPTEEFVCWLPLYHDLGFYSHVVAALGLGMPLTLMKTKQFLADPGSWLIELSRARAHHSAAPNFAFGLVSRSIGTGMSSSVDLSSMRGLISGGEQINPSSVRAFLELAVPLGLDPSSFVGGYGLAEAVCGVTTRRPGLGLLTDIVNRDELASGKATPAPSDTVGTSEFASVGTPFPDVELEIRGSSGETLGEREVGEIFLRGPMLMDAYLDDPERTDEVLVDGWLRTGDLAYQAGGDTFVTGRVKDMIIVRGQNFFPEDIERIVERIPGVRKGCSAAVALRRRETEGIGLVVETRLESVADKESCERQISREMWRETGLIPDRVLLVPPGSLPKTTSGKLQRSRVGRLLQRAEGEIVELANE